MHESELSLAQVTNFNRRSDVNSSIKKMMGEESTYTGLHSQANNRKSTSDKKYILLQSILAHKNTISGICCKNEGYLVTASLDHSLKVSTPHQFWGFYGNLLNRSPIYSIKDNAQITALANDQNRIVMGNRDGFIKVLDV